MIYVEGLTAGYSEKQVISRLSFSCSSEDSPLVLAGKNGSGKSTFLKAVLGQIPFQGLIKLEESNSGIGWISQSYHISLSIPVIDFIALGTSKTKGVFTHLPSNAKDLAVAALLELGLDDLKEKKTDQLSGGEWQLVCLAQLMVQDTGVWLLDEPTSSLDIYYKSLVFNLLWKKSREGKLIIFSTHDLPFLPKERGKLLLFENEVSSFPISENSLAEAISRLSQRQVFKK